MNNVKYHAVGTRFRGTIMVTYVCPKCGTVVDLVYKGGCIPSCCGTPMEPVEAKTEDFVKEKHVPYIEKVDGGVLVKVGKETAHPMADDHYIVYIEICADGVRMRKYLKPGDAPEAFFKTDAEKVTAWEYCNKHGLWKSNQ